MKTRMSESSIAAFIKSDRKTALKKVYNCISIIEGGATYEEIHRFTNIKHATITGRINELRYDYQLVVADGSISGKTLYRLRKFGEAPDERPLSWEQKYEKLIGELVSLHNSIAIAKQMNSASVENIFQRLREIIINR